MFAKTTTLDILDFNTLLNAFPEEFVEISPQEQGLAIALYRLLALGDPVTYQRLSEITAMSIDEVDRLLNAWPGVCHDEKRKVTGFWGLALDEMPHKMLVDRHELCAWSAWDTLCLPVLIGKTAQINSHCAESGVDIRFTIDPENTALSDVGTKVISFVTPDEKGIRVYDINNFSHSVLFFASLDLGEQWIARHSGTFLMSIQNAFELARLFNKRKFSGLVI